jgi:hypothetical protein
VLVPVLVRVWVWELVREVVLVRVLERLSVDTD